MLWSMYKSIKMCPAELLGGESMGKVARGEWGSGDKDLLEAEEVADYLSVNPVTVYRWCREGRLSCLKIGRHWRIRRQALEDFLQRSEQPTTLFDHLQNFIKVPDNLIAIAQTQELMHRIDATFFMVGDIHGGALVKFYGKEKVLEEELRRDFKDAGLEVQRLEEEGRLRFINEEDPAKRNDLLMRLLEEDSENGQDRGTLWVSFDWSEQLSLEEALEHQEKISQITSRRLVVKTAALEEAIDTWPPALLRQAEVTHSGQIWLSGSGISMSRVASLQD